MVPQAAPSSASLGQSAGLGRAGRPYQTCFRSRRPLEDVEPQPPPRIPSGIPQDGGDDDHGLTPAGEPDVSPSRRDRTLHHEQVLAGRHVMPEAPSWAVPLLTAPDLLGRALRAPGAVQAPGCAAHAGRAAYRPGPSGKLRCGRVARPKAPILRLPTPAGGSGGATR